VKKMFGGGGSSSSTTESILPTFQDEPACAGICPQLTYMQRIMGYAACTGIGFLLSLMGTLVLFGGTNSKNIRTFAVLYVLGNIIALCATGFLLGPQKQCVKMWQPTRRWSTSLYLIMIIVVFIVAIMRQNVFLVLFLLLVEIIVGCWYSLSYVPFGRKIVCSFFRALGVFAPCFYVYDSCAESCQSKSKSSNNVFSGSSSNTSNPSATVFGGSSNNNNSSGSFFGSGGNTASKDTRNSFW
jgi:hypothetical protein